MRTQALDAFQVIADPSRRQILYMLSQKGSTINSLAENFEMSRPAVSKHIKVLYEGGFITIEDKGRERYCNLNKDGFNELHEWLNYYDNFWKLKLKKLENLLNEKAKKSKGK